MQQVKGYERLSHMTSNGRGENFCKTGGTYTTEFMKCYPRDVYPFNMYACVHKMDTEIEETE
jgi:hypothetical protein